MNPFAALNVDSIMGTAGSAMPAWLPYFVWAVAVTLGIKLVSKLTAAGKSAGRQKRQTYDAQPPQQNGGR